MKKLFTLGALVAFSFGVANAQNKAEATRAKVVTEKEALRSTGSTSKKAELKTKAESSTENAKKAEGFMTQEQFDAHRRELEANPKKSTKPKAKQN